MPRLAAWCVAALLAAAAAMPGLAAAPKQSAPAAKAEDAKPVPEDPLGRATPYGTVFGFVRAADAGDYTAAAAYLEGTQPLAEKEQLARTLHVVLNRALKIGLEDLSKVPEGRLEDGLNVYMEKVGTVTHEAHRLDILLRRTTKSDSPPIWLFAAESLRGAGAMAADFELPWSEAIWPERLRQIHFISYPLFRLVNQVVATVLVLVASVLLVRLVLLLLRPLARSNTEYGGILARTARPLSLLVFAVLMRWFAMESVSVAGRIFFTTTAEVLVVVAVCWLFVRLTRFSTGVRIRRLQQFGNSSAIASAELSGWLVIAAGLLLGLVLILKSLGFEVTAAIAGLGVGGIVLAFAAQKTIENLFGTFTIVTDKPINVGDSCRAGSTEGAIESIGLRSTRIRTLDRALVTIPNGQLAGMTIANFGPRDKFLFRQNLQLRYGARAEQVREVLGRLRSMLSEHRQVEHASARIRLVRLGDSGLELETFAYIPAKDWTSFLEIQEELLLRIMDIVEEGGCAIACTASPAAPAAGAAFEAPAPRSMTRTTKA